MLQKYPSKPGPMDIVVPSQTVRSPQVSSEWETSFSHLPEFSSLTSRQIHVIITPKCRFFGHFWPNLAIFSPKMAKNGQKWPKMAKNRPRGRLYLGLRHEIEIAKSPPSFHFWVGWVQAKPESAALRVSGRVPS